MEKNLCRIARGYYTRSNLVTYSWDGNNLKEHWPETVAGHQCLIWKSSLMNSNKKNNETYLSSTGKLNLTNIAQMAILMLEKNQ